MAKSYTAKVANSWMLGGPKYIQYRSWVDFAEHSGCTAGAQTGHLSKLPFMPEQYLLTDCKECKNFWAAADSYPTQPRTWYVKTAMGASAKLHAAHGIEIHTNLTQLRKDYGDCRAATDGANGPRAAHYIAQAEIQPLLVHADYSLDGPQTPRLGFRKFDFRCFLVISRAHPR
eukprot:SAG31_NODE_22680_length_520_cov_0.862233_1_plen_172_part_11